jgi:ribonuclease HI
MWNLRKPTPPGHLWLFCDGSTGALVAPDPAQVDSGANANLRTLLRGAMHCAAAAVAANDDGALLDWAWRPLPAVTNNEAEYAGLVLGLELAHRLGSQRVTCVLDNAVVIGQMEGRFAIHHAPLRRWYWQAQAAARLLAHVRYCQAPREWNRLADGLAAHASVPWLVLRQALEEQVKG